LNEDALRSDLAPHSHRQFLAALKHAGAVRETPAEAWALMLCSSKSYVEAIFRGAPTPGFLQAVRMGRSDHRRVYDSAPDALRKKAMGSRIDLIEKFVEIQAYLRARGIQFEVVEND